ncbi:MAG: IS607 family transposase [Oscillospiraceae bacterium]|nr:IS607 family transposase [Oscillospiraceae bacterium]
MSTKEMSITEFAETLGVIPDTVRRWEREGEIKPKRTSGGHRRYTQQDVYDILGTPETIQKRKIIYGRVSAPDMKLELRKQVEAVEYFALGRGIKAETITEYGNGLDMARPELVNIIKGIINGEIDTLLIAHKDRLSRFGYEFIEYIAKQYGCEIIVASGDKLSPPAEVLEDMRAVLERFSQRLGNIAYVEDARILVGGTSEKAESA